MTFNLPVIGQDPWGATLNLNLEQLGAGELATDHNLLAWSYPASIPVGTTSPTSGVLNVTRVPLRQQRTITNVLTAISAAGVGLTAGQNFAALYDSNGVRQGVTADQTVNFGSAGTKEMPLTAPYVAPAGFYWVAILMVGGTTPTVLRTLQNSSMLNNWGSTAATSFAATFGAGLTATPASFTPASLVQSQITYWAGLS